MSTQTLGFCGKLPTNGDFVQRRVPADFSQGWDAWLEQGLHAAQLELGERWLRSYEAAPAWRFALAPNVCGRAGVCGLMLPSMDRVGRQFPLTVVRTLAAGERPLQALCGDSSWFEALEALLMMTARGSIGSLEQFDQGLQKLPPPASAARAPEPLAASGDQALPDPQSLLQLMAALAQDALASKSKTPSYWWTRGSQVLGASFRWRGGLPQVREFSRWLSDPGRVPQTATLLPADIPFEDLLAGSAEPDPVVERAPPRAARPEAVAASTAPELAPIDDPLALFGGGELAPAIASRVEDLIEEPRAPEESVPGESAPEMISTGWLNAMSEETAAAPADSFLSAAVSDRGKRRKSNQDAYLDAAPRQLWAVADGLGGWKDGEKASRMVVEALASIPKTAALAERVRAGENALAEVNRQLHARAADLLEPVESGSTVVAMFGVDDQLAILWAGDSRAYRLRGGRLEQLTRDHSLAQAALDANEGAHDGDSESIPDSIITRAIGAGRALEVEVQYHSAQAGDRYLLCSDGLYRELALDVLQALLRQGTPADICERMRARVLDGPASDNLTAVVIECRG